MNSSCNSKTKKTPASSKKRPSGGGGGAPSCLPNKKPKQQQKTLASFFAVAAASKKPSPAITSSTTSSNKKQQQQQQQKQQKQQQKQQQENQENNDATTSTRTSPGEGGLPHTKKRIVSSIPDPSSLHVNSNLAQEQQQQQQQQPQSSNKKAKQQHQEQQEPYTAVPRSGSLKYLKKPYTAGENYAILTHPQEMFDDMIFQKIIRSNNNNNNNNHMTRLRGLVQKLQNRPLRLATMCSGTESPVLALDMLQRSLQDAVRDYPEKFGTNTVGSNQTNSNSSIDSSQVFPLEHVFSCEIEPFKQAYIERNFHPPLLFRDIRELGNTHAYTAYGSLVPVPNRPGDVDVLIAGTSCVDYSNLNNKKKELEDGGESGATFVGMMKWIQTCGPPIVILENVYGAPWATKVKWFQDIGYSATFVRLDTKDYYIPHTRQRGYLFAIRQIKAKVTGRIRLDNRPKEWAALVHELARPASATLDEYLLPRDDPRVLRGRARLTAESDKATTAGRTDWTKCETRHLAARSMEELGEQRPFTNWSDSGTTTLPAWCWSEWYNQQVNRIHDLSDINTLRLAVDGVDATHKTMVWNLSQNVDRDTMGKPGLCQCLTPTGVPYVTNRGGPAVGEELLMLQGIPADDLLLTKESEDNLKDLAGNAMSTTVVGACTLSALLIGYTSLPDREDDSLAGAIVPCLVPRALKPVTSDIEIRQSFGDYKTSIVDLSPKRLPDESALKNLLQQAASSTRMCVSEGSEVCIPYEHLVQCRECGQTTAAANANPPRKFEEHDFVTMYAENATRADPSAFRRQLLECLPMRLTLEGFDVDSLREPENVDSNLWTKWIAAFRRTATTSGRPPEFFFTELLRSHIWTAVFGSSCGGRLEARVSKLGVTWFLFAKASKKKGALKTTLERPLARMMVKVPSIGPFSLLDGTWEFLLPIRSAVTLSIQGIGEKVPSWRNRLGLKGRFESEYTYPELQIAVTTFSCGTKTRIDGRYKLLPKCGSACGSLMKRVDGSSINGEETFFFLESGPKSLPEEDAYVFAPSCHRTIPGEYRETFLEIDSDLCYRPLVNGTGKITYHVEVEAFETGQWLAVNSATLKSLETSEMIVSCPVDSLDVPMKPDTWKTCPELVSCQVKINSSADIFLQCKKAGGSVDINLQKSKQTFKNLSFAISRLDIPRGLFGDGNWKKLCQPPSNLVDEQLLTCWQCAPPKPLIKWTVITKGKTSVFAPMEDGIEAAAYERALKARPQPWLVRLGADEDGIDSKLSITIGCNAFSLVQRALSLLPKDSDGRKFMVAHNKSPHPCNNITTAMCSFEWRVVPHVELESAHFDKLEFSSNRHDELSEQPPNFKKYPLRKEQLRSLKWMIQQESTTEPFFEEEVAEAVLPSLNWRLESRVRRPVLIRAGVVADEVGYGKTAISLGLIDSTRSIKVSEEELPEHFRKGYIHTNATCVCVPKHLMGQWPEEIKKFLGKSMQMLVLKDLSVLNSVTVKDIQEADIVVVSFALLSNEKYFSRLARLCGKNPASLPTGSHGGRHFGAVYQECTKSLGERVSRLSTDCSTVYGDIEKDAKRHETQQEEKCVRLDGKKAVYKKGDAASEFSTSKFKLAPSERDPWGLSEKGVKEDYKQMKCPPLEAFLWKRVIVDEFTYLGKADRERCFTAINEMKSLFRWMLSGTPKHSNFNDISSLASLLGVRLGVDEVLPGAKLSKANLSESTGLESLSSYMESRSMQWHHRRHMLGQGFLDRFVRQNIAEIDEIPFEEHECVVELPPAERAIYLELETHLTSVEMNSKSAQKSKRKSTGDRESRMQKILKESKSGEEALLKCCSTFALSADSSSAIETVDQIIELRVSEKNHLEEEFVRSVTAAFQQRQRIVDLQPGWASLTETGKGEMQDALGVYLEYVERHTSVPHGADEEVNIRIDKIIQKAEACFEKNPRPTARDSYFAEAELEDDDEAGDENDKGGSSKKAKKSKKSTFSELTPEKQTIRLFAMKTALRNHMHNVRSLSKELCGRVRSLRYVEMILRFQKDQENYFECSNCLKTKLKPEDVGVLSCCGHHGCLACLRASADSGQCLVPHCSARVAVPHVVPGEQFCGSTAKASSGKYGCKMSAIVKKVKELIEEEDDRVIVFCQFDDLTEKVQEALASSGVKSLQVSGTVTQQIHTISVFQKDVPAKGDPRVLLLKMDDEQSAGLNLTNMNHAVFVNPLLADTQQEYDAYETQAIGRIRRFGQKKTVHVWRFLARDTIDTTIYSQRSSRPVPPLST